MQSPEGDVMAKNRKAGTNKRKRRAKPARTAPRRSAADHVKRNTRPPKESADADRSERAQESIADTVQNTIAGMVDRSYTFIDRQIGEARDAAGRLRADLATSPQLNTNINNLVEGLVGTTRDIGATWLDLISIVLRSVGPQSTCSAPSAGLGAFGQAGATRSRPGTTTSTGTSGGAKTVSSITPIDPSGPHQPPMIEVRGIRVKSVTLDLRPPSIQFMPLVRPLAANAPRLAPLAGVKFEFSADQTRAVLKVKVSRNQPAGTYTGAIVDSITNEPGGTVSVTVGS
jgi:hypothetical protein